MYEYSGNATTGSEQNLITTGLPVGVKAISYLDPTDLSKYCVESTSTSTTGTKSGCMKWYAFKEESTSYTMILDHNTKSNVVWNSENDSTSMKEVQTELNNLVNVTKWKVTPRLIKAQEIADITGNTSWTAGESSYFYFDSNNQTQMATSEGASKYHWLFDYTESCAKNGCKVADSSTYGYWTDTISNSSWSDNHYAWRVDCFGRLTTLNIRYNDNGLRPVITVSKSNF